MYHLCADICELLKSLLDIPVKNEGYKAKSNLPDTKLLSNIWPRFELMCKVLEIQEHKFTLISINYFIYLSALLISHARNPCSFTPPPRHKSSEQLHWSHNDDIVICAPIINRRKISWHWNRFKKKKTSCAQYELNLKHARCIDKVNYHRKGKRTWMGHTRSPVKQTNKCHSSQSIRDTRAWNDNFKLTFKKFARQ